VLLGTSAWPLFVGTRSVSVWVVLDEAGRWKGPISANQSLARVNPWLAAVGKIPVVDDLADGFRSIVGDDWDGKNILFNVGMPGASGTLGNICGGAGAEATDPERHCEGLRAGGNEPTWDSENGHLMLLRMTRVE